jgi:hypothetical protein
MKYPPALSKRTIVTAATVALTALTIAILPAASSAQANTPAQLADHRVYWNTTLSDFAMVSVSTDTAAMAAVDGDLIRAARALAYGDKFLNRAAAALHQIPADWRGNVAPHLSQATRALTAAGNAMRLFLAHGRVADLKAAQTDEARASAELATATSEAKAAYTAIGGDAAALESMPHAMQNANAALASAMGDTDTDDQ